MLKQQGTQWHCSVSAALAVCWSQGHFETWQLRWIFYVAQKKEDFFWENRDWEYTKGYTKVAHSKKKKAIRFLDGKKACKPEDEAAG